MNRFTIIESKEKKNHWVCTDNDNFLQCTFENKNFNDNQQFTFTKPLDSSKLMEAAKFAREMGDWLRLNHYDKIF